MSDAPHGTGEYRYGMLTTSNVRGKLTLLETQPPGNDVAADGVATP